MTNEERWDAFIVELRAYIEEHHLGPSKHTSLRNKLVYFRRKMRDGELNAEKAEELERVLSMRDLSIHTGGRKKSIRLDSTNSPTKAKEPSKTSPSEDEEALT